MPFKSLKNHLSSLATSAISGAVSNFISAGKQKDAGKVSAQLLKKGPFDIPNSPSQALRENPLSFSAVQYPLDLGSNELGHYIIFSSGFFAIHFFLWVYKLCLCLYDFPHSHMYNDVELFGTFSSTFVNIICLRVSKCLSN